MNRQVRFLEGGQRAAHGEHLIRGGRNVVPERLTQVTSLTSRKRIGSAPDDDPVGTATTADRAPGAVAVTDRCVPATVPD